MTAQLGFQPSFSWRSILQGRDFLRQFCSWKVGHGFSLKFWSDRWLANGGGLVSYNTMADNANLSVAELINRDSGTWDITRIRNLLPGPIANQVLSTRFDIYNDDEIWWPHEPLGEYTVSSAYKLAVQAETHSESSSSGMTSNFWDKLWALPVHPRIRTLLWKIAWGILSTCWRLKNKGIEGQLNCYLCDRAIKTLHHLLCECQVTRRIWDLLNLSHIYRLQSPSARQWLHGLLFTLNADDMVKVAYGFECIWEARNGVAFHSQSFTVERMVARAINSIQAFNEAFTQEQLSRNLSRPSRRTPSVTRWQSPPATSFKLNFDASCKVNSNGVGLGAIIRDCTGKFVAGLAEFVDSNWPSNLGEAEAARRGLLLAIRLNLKSVTLEGDAAILIDQLQGRLSHRGADSACVNDILHLSRHFDNLAYCWVPREANETADRMSKWARHNAQSNTWLSTPPLWLTDALLLDCS